MWRLLFVYVVIVPINQLDQNKETPPLIGVFYVPPHSQNSMQQWLPLSHWPQPLLTLRSGMFRNRCPNLCLPPTLAIRHNRHSWLWSTSTSSSQMNICSLVRDASVLITAFSINHVPCSVPNCNRLAWYVKINTSCLVQSKWMYAFI